MFEMKLHFLIWILKVSVHPLIKLKCEHYEILQINVWTESSRKEGNNNVPTME